MRFFFLSVLFLGCMTPLFAGSSPWYLPIKATNRQSTEDVALTQIGPFGLMRKPRPNIPAHHHTGCDLRRPSENHIDEPVYPAAGGIVVSMRDDGPYAQIIIEHTFDSAKIWTVYEHVAGITVVYGDTVVPDRPVARFMTRAELDKYGWQFDHLHFEVMKVAPVARSPDRTRPYMHAGTYALVCYSPRGLAAHYHDPLQFLQEQWSPPAVGLIPQNTVQSPQ